MNVHCPLCQARLDETRWVCPSCGPVPYVLATPDRRAVNQAISVGPLFYLRRCTRCGVVFSSKDSKHRFCKSCLPAWLRRQPLRPQLASG